MVECLYRLQLHLFGIYLASKQGGLGKLDISLLAEKSLSYGVIDDETGVSFCDLFFIESSSGKKLHPISDLSIVHLPLHGSTMSTWLKCQTYLLTASYNVD